MDSGSKIKILIFTPTLQCGGSEKFVSTLCNNINSDKFSVCLVVLNNANPFYKIKNKAIEVIDLKQRRVLFSLFKIRRAVKAYQPDIIFTTANHLNLYFAFFRRMFPKGIKILARESNIVSINNQKAKMPALYDLATKKYYKRVDFIICQSTDMQQDLINNYSIPPEKLKVIHNPVDVVISPRAATRSTSEVRKFITVARLSDQKGIERLVHAVGLLLVPFEFYIIGEGDKRDSLQKLVNELQLQDKVFFVGERTEPFNGFEDADLFLMGSYYEGFPNVLLEAGALGIPVVAFDVLGGIAEIITDEENGLLVDDNDIIGFASAINRALNMNFNRQQIAENTTQRFSVNSMLAAMEQLFIKMT